MGTGASLDKAAVLARIINERFYAIADPLHLRVKRRKECVCIHSCEIRDTLHEERTFGRFRHEPS